MGYKGALLAAFTALLITLFAIVPLPPLSFKESLFLQLPTLSQHMLSRKIATMTSAEVNTAASFSTALISRSVVKKVPAIETPEGKGALVRRSIGTPQLRNLSPFLMLDHFKVSEGAGFPDQ